MCEECGCNGPEDKKEKKPISNNLIDKSVTEANDIIAHHIEHTLKEKKVLCINLMGSPGSGKTTFIEGLSKHLNPEELAVIQGDLESDIDKKRLEKINIHTYQINTHSGCHLNAAMINKAILGMDLSHKKYLIIENVGNLVCPAGVKIGQHLNVVVSSVTEGADKPKKYPYIFMDAALILISKSDLEDLVEFNEQGYLNDIKNINRMVKIIKISSKLPASFGEAAHFLQHQRDHMLGKEHHH